MIRWMIKKFSVLFLFPLIGIVGFFWFFYSYLNPAQRDVIFKEIMASLPIAKNFVNVNYKTHLSITGVKDAKNLKTAFYSVDYLGSIRNSKGDRYIAVYPFQIEAGFDLGQSDIICPDAGPHESKKVTIKLPAPVITTVDLDDKKQVMIIRDGIKKGDHEYILRPVKKAFELQARDYAVRNNILDKAKENALAYYHKILGGIYDEVNITFDSQENEFSDEVRLPNIPIKFNTVKKVFDYNFYASDSFETYDGMFDNGNGIILVGYSDKYDKSFQDLWQTVAKQSPKDAILKFIDPESPLENGVVCEYDQEGGTCYAQKKGKLLYLVHVPSDAENAKRTLGDLLYLSFNARYDGSRPNEEKYVDFIDLLKRARANLEDENFGEMKITAENIARINQDNQYGKLLLAVSDTLNSKSFTSSSGHKDIDLLLQLYSTIDREEYGDIDERLVNVIFDNFSEKKYSNFLNDFRSILVMNKEKLALPDHKFQNFLVTLAQSGHLTYELMNKLPFNLWTYALKVKLQHINERLNSNKQSDGNMLFCDTDGNWNSYSKDCSSNIYYDRDAIEGVLSQGKNTIGNQMDIIFNNFSLKGEPDEHIAIVLTRGMFLYDYDLFVLKKNGLFLHKDVTDGIDEDNAYSSKYSSLNPGTGIIKLADENYRNTAFLKLLTELHEISYNKSKGTRDKVLTFLKKRIVELSQERIWLPTLYASK